MKRFIAVLTILALILTLTACSLGSSAKKKAVKAQTPVATATTYISDERLIGEWVATSLKSDGTYCFGLTSLNAFFSANVIFMFNGYCYGELPKTIYGLEDAGSYTSPLSTVFAEDGTMSFPEASVGARDGNMNCTIEYSFQNIDTASIYNNDPQVDKLYAEADNDQMTMKFSGTYRESATSLLTIDCTFVFEKNLVLPKTDILKTMLPGKWCDNLGNTWEFFIAKGKYSDYALSFEMTDGSGNTFHADDADDSAVYFILTKDKDENLVNSLSFNFDQKASVNNISGTFKLYNSDMISVTYYDGFELILTRA